MSHAARLPKTWIRSTSFLATLGWLATGCGTSSASAVTPTKAPLATASAVEAPPHVFTPRPHPARVHERPPAPDLAALPPMIDRTRSCFAVEVEDEGWSSPPTRHRGTKRKTKPSPPGFVPYGGGKGSGGISRPSAPKKDAGGGRTAGATKSSSSDMLGGLGDGGGAAPSSPTPAASPEPAPVAPASESKNTASKPLAPLPAEEAPAIATDPDDGYHDWGAAIYLSNDDTMSLSSAQRVIFAIDGFLPLPAEHIRPHELLNYFSFDTAPVREGNDFSVESSIAPDPEQEGIYTLAMAVRGRPLALEERRNANLSIVIDRSGSMSAEGRMTYLRRGLEQMTGQLKTGDMVHLVLFDHEVCTAVENFVVGRDRPELLMNAVRQLEPRGSTDLHAGLTAGYQLADRTYQPTYTNRVVMITDAIANTGITDEQLISTVGKYYDDRRIRLSGVGVGREFNDALLDKLTERGKGAYVFLGSEAEVDAVFGPRFISLVETTANDVHFQLHLPPSLRMNVFYGEESSTVKEDVQAIHYFANTSQLFLSDLMARGGELRLRLALRVLQLLDRGAALVEHAGEALHALALRVVLARELLGQRADLRHVVLQALVRELLQATRHVQRLAVHEIQARALHFRGLRGVAAGLRVRVPARLPVDERLLRHAQRFGAAVRFLVQRLDARLGLGQRLRERLGLHAVARDVLDDLAQLQLCFAAGALQAFGEVLVVLDLLLDARDLAADAVDLALHRVEVVGGRDLAVAVLLEVRFHLALLRHELLDLQVDRLQRVDLRLELGVLRLQRQCLELGFHSRVLALQLLPALGGLRLPVEMLQRLLDFLAHVVQAIEVLARRLDARLGLLAALLVLRDARGLLEVHAQVLGPRLDDLGNHSLLDDRVAARAEARAEEHVDDVAAATARAVEVIARLAIAADAALHRDLGEPRVLAGDQTIGVVEDELDGGRADRLAPAGTREDHVREVVAAQAARGRLAHHPADGVDDVRLAAAVRTDDARHVRGQVQRRRIDEGLEAGQLDRGQTHRGISL